MWVEPHEGQAVAVAPGALLRVMESDLSQRQVRASACACAGPTGDCSMCRLTYANAQPPWASCCVSGRGTVPGPGSTPSRHRS